MKFSVLLTSWNILIGNLEQEPYKIQNWNIPQLECEVCNNFKFDKTLDINFITQEQHDRFIDSYQDTIIHQTEHCLQIMDMGFSYLKDPIPKRLLDEETREYQCYLSSVNDFLLIFPSMEIYYITNKINNEEREENIANLKSKNVRPKNLPSRYIKVGESRYIQVMESESSMLHIAYTRNTNEYY